jgi:NCAIR mutase (PurE)-related protein
MDPEMLRTLLTDLADGRVDVPAAMQRLRALPFETLDHATVDHHRALRCGSAEVVFAEGKTVEQLLQIMDRLRAGGHPVLATRMSAEQLDAFERAFASSPTLVSRLGRSALLQPPEVPADGPRVALVCAGTSDLSVLEEASLTLRAMRVRHERIVDVGVAGLHRLLPHVPTLQSSVAVIVIAGMEGALPSMTGGLVSCPVYAVPTSVGYGLSMRGLAALLGMLNSCASNVSVVNIDNGFGAACCAAAVARPASAAGAG